MDKRTAYCILSVIVLVAAFFLLALIAEYAILQLLLFMCAAGLICFMRFGKREVFIKNGVDSFRSYNIFIGVIILISGGSIMFNRYEIQTSISRVFVKGVKANIEVVALEDEDGDEVYKTEFNKPIFPSKYVGGLFYWMDIILIWLVVVVGYFSFRWGNQNLDVSSLNKRKDQSSLG